MFGDRIKLLKITGIALLICGGIGLMYVMGNSDAQLNDLASTLILFGMGIYSLYMSNKIQKDGKK